MRKNHPQDLASESQAVGWISSTDAMLLFVAMLTVVALVFQRQWAAAEQDRESLATSGEQHSNELAAEINRLDKRTRELLARLTQSQAELTRLKEFVKEAGGDYATAVREIERLNNVIADAKTQSQKLMALIEAGKQRDALLREQERLNKELESALQLAQGEMKRLTLELQKRESLASLEKQLDRLKEQYAKTQQDLSAERDLTRRMRAAGIELKRRHEAFLKEYASLQTGLKSRDDRIAEIEIAYERSKKEYAKRQRDQAGVKRELVGLKGDLKRVAILFDASGSMNENGRWDSARKVVEAWLSHLEMKEFTVIVFNSAITTFPEDGSLLSFDHENAQTRRQELSDFLAKIQPRDGTNTRAALERAYQIPGLDTVILFTDGAPNDGNSAVFDRNEAEKIYSLCQARPEVPINTVGLGDYFKPDLSGFLMRMAEITKGSYLGR